MSFEKSKAVNDLEVHLRIIADIPSSSKYNVLSRTYSPYGSTLASLRTGIFRFVQGENRHSTYNFIEEKITDAIKLIEEYPDQQDYIIRLITNLRTAVSNLANTYTSDPEIRSKYRSLSNRIQKGNLLALIDLQKRQVTESVETYPPEQYDSVDVNAFYSETDV